MTDFSNSDIFKIILGDPQKVDTQEQAAPIAAAAATAPAPQAEPEAPIEVKGFAPSKIPLLTRIGDVLTGNRFHMVDHIRQHDVQRALEGYSDDPRAAILRVMKIPGLAGPA